jgi:hypothetical protein
MPGINAKETFSPFNRKIVIDPQCQLIEKHMAIRTKAKDVFRDIRPIVGAPKRLNVADFCIRACHCYQLYATDLAGRIVQSLHPFTTDSTKNTDMHLYVYDEAGKEVGKDDSPGPKCSVKVTPAKDGKYKFVIKNAGEDNTVTFEVKIAK